MLGDKVLMGVPATNALMFSTVTRLIRSIDSTQLNAVCGVQTTSGRKRRLPRRMSFSICFARRGSFDDTLGLSTGSRNFLDNLVADDSFGAPSHHAFLSEHVEPGSPNNALIERFNQRVCVNQFSAGGVDDHHAWPAFGKGFAIKCDSWKSSRFACSE